MPDQDISVAAVAERQLRGARPPLKSKLARGPHAS
jgi:hypothetical protein